jgi:hypothetical protein
VLDLAGASTLETARARARFPVRLPSYPPDLGEPDAVFVQSEPSPVVIMAWHDPTDPTAAKLALYQIGAEAYFAKIEPRVIQETEVNGLMAIWAEGPHMLLNRSRQLEFRRLVQGNVLIWTEGEVTYRLESGLELDEARRIAESLR